MSPRALASVLLPLLLVLACSSGSSNGTSNATRHDLANEGTLCVYPASEDPNAPSFPDSTLTYPAGESVNVVVVFPPCLSGSCTKERMASCSVTASGGGLHVASSGSFLDIGDGIRRCTNDCGHLVARCATAPLPAGTHTFEHGTDTLTLTLPFSGVVPCVGAL